MEEEKNEEQTSKNQTEEGTSEETTEKTGEESKDLQSALAQKEHFRDKAEKLEKELGELREKLPKPESPTSVEKPEVWEAPEDPLETVKLGKALKDYNDEETEFILKNAPTKNLEGILKSEKDPYIQAAIQAMREKVKTEQAVSEPSSAVAGSFKVKNSEEVEKMTPEERRSYAEAFIAHKSKGSGI